MREPVDVLIAEEVYAPVLEEIRRHEGRLRLKIIPRQERSRTLDLELLGDPEILMATFPPRNLRDLGRLRWLQLGSAGYEQIFDLPVVEMGITVTNASGVSDVPIAEWCLLMMFLFERDFRRVLDNQSARLWDRDPKFQSELRGRLVGIFGYGSIGREIGRQCRALGLRIWVMNRSAIGRRNNRFLLEGTGDPDGTLPERVFRLDEMEEFLPPLDYLVLALPRTPRTEGILGEYHLRLLKPSAVLLNAARAELVEESALLAVLRENRIAGAALDVHYRFPLPAGHPFWELQNVILTPWISGSTGSPYYLQRLWRLFKENLGRYLAGEPLLNVIPPQELVREHRGTA